MNILVPQICDNYEKNFVDEKLKSILNFYSSPENNENLRFIALKGIEKLNRELLNQIPVCIFNLLLDDNEDIRNGACKILNPSITLNLFETLKQFIYNLKSSKEFSDFLDAYDERNSRVAKGTNRLFEKEPLNLFIDTQYLRKRACIL